MAVEISALEVCKSLLPNITSYTSHATLIAARNVDREIEEQALYSIIPQSWRQRCTGRPTPATSHNLLHGSPGWQAEAQILQRMQFSAFPVIKGLTALPAVTVRHLTAIQMHTVHGPRHKRMLAYAAEAECVDREAAVRKLRNDTFRQVWVLPWENKRKEILWRLAVNGVAMYGAARYTAGQPLPCLCNCGAVSRRHHFWDCSIAAAVVQELQLGLDSAAPLGGVTREQLWLLQPPPGVHRGIWQVAALAALSSMDAARRRLTSLCMPAINQRKQHQQQQAPHTTNHNPPDAAQRVIATPEQLQLVRVFAIERFWSSIHDFASLNHLHPPVAWTAQSCRVQNDQPFFKLVQQPDDTDDQREWRLGVHPRPLPPVLPDGI